jgi:RNA polymerase sigma-70 factor (ECF subfamily)
VPIYLEDKQLVKRALAGDEQAFAQFFDDNFPRLYRFVLPRLSDDPAGAREVVHLALSRALRKLHTFRAESSLFTWLCVICRNELSDWLRSSLRHREHVVLTEDYPEIRAAVESFNIPDSQSPERQYQRGESVRLIQVALDALPPKYGNALEWKYIEGFSTREIAARLNISAEATQSVLARARRAFQDVYGSMNNPVLNESVNIGRET